VFLVDEARFEELVADALDSLPEDLAKAMDNVTVRVDDGTPTGNVLGLYRGHPQTQRSLWYDSAPDVITIYRLPICARCHNEDEVARQVRRTVVHEVGHHFGIDDPRLRELGW
jgi:predicted Zn-dependent protease with MMP-like domain